MDEKLKRKKSPVWWEASGPNHLLSTGELGALGILRGAVKQSGIKRPNLYNKIPNWIKLILIIFISILGIYVLSVS